MHLQEKIWNDVAQQIINAGFDGVDNPQWGNKGMIMIQDKNSIQTFGSVKYDFQYDTMEFSIKINGKNIPSQKGRNDYFDFYLKYEDFNGYNRFIGVLLEQLAKINV